MSHYTRPEHRSSALVTIDTQRDTLDGRPFEIPGTSEAVPKIAALAQSFRRRRLPVIHVVRIYMADGTNVDVVRREDVEAGAPLVLAGTEGSQIAEPLLPSPDIRLDAERLLDGDLQRIGPDEWIMYKPRWGAFYRTPLERHLLELDVSTLVFAGCNFPNCPRASIYEASERDFRIVVVTDAISGLYDRGRVELEGIGAILLSTEEYLRGSGR